MKLLGLKSNFKMYLSSYNKNHQIKDRGKIIKVSDYKGFYDSVM